MGRTRLEAIIENIDDNDIRDLAHRKLRAVTSGLKGTLIEKMDVAKKTALLNGLGANYFSTVKKDDTSALNRCIAQSGDRVDQMVCQRKFNKEVVNWSQNDIDASIFANSTGSTSITFDRKIESKQSDKLSKMKSLFSIKTLDGR